MEEVETIEIRVRPDGFVLFERMTAELLAAAAAVNPRDPSIAKKLAQLDAMNSERVRVEQGEIA